MPACRRHFATLLPAPLPAWYRTRSVARPLRGRGPHGRQHELLPNSRPERTRLPKRQDGRSGSSRHHRGIRADIGASLEIVSYLTDCLGNERRPALTLATDSTRTRRPSRAPLKRSPDGHCFVEGDV